MSAAPIFSIGRTTANMLVMLKILVLLLILALQAVFIVSSRPKAWKLIFLTASALCVLAVLVLNIAKAGGAF